MSHVPHATTLARVAGAADAYRWETAILVGALALLAVGIPAVIIAYRRWTR